MFVLGLDLSVSSTGVSVISCCEGNVEVALATKIMTEKKDFKSEDERINYIVDRVKMLIDLFPEKIELAVIEEQFISGRAKTIMVLRKLLGAISRMLYKEANIKTLYLAPTTVKKAITGTGKSKKDEIANVIKERYIDIGEYSDKTGKLKTSDIYDSISIAIAGIPIKEVK